MRLLQGLKRRIAKMVIGQSKDLILSLLDDAPNGLTGLEMINRSDGALKRGTIYVYLQRMEEAGLIRKEPADKVGELTRYRYFKQS